MKHNFNSYFMCLELGRLVGLLEYAGQDALIGEDPATGRLAADRAARHDVGAIDSGHDSLPCKLHLINSYLASFHC